MDVDIDRGRSILSLVHSCVRDSLALVFRHLRHFELRCAKLWANRRKLQLHVLRLVFIFRQSLRAALVTSLAMPAAKAKITRRPIHVQVVLQHFH